MKKSKLYISACLIIFIFQNCTSDYSKNLGDGYFYRFEASDLRDIHCKKANGGEIPADIVEYNFDNKFIIAKQKPKLPQDPLYDKTYNYPNGENGFYYWLIIKESNTVFGPLSITELDSLKTEYKAPKALILK